MADKSQGDRWVGMVAKGGIIVLSVLLILAMGGYGVRLLAAMASVPKPETPVTPPAAVAGAASGAKTAASPSTPATPAPAGSGQATAAEPAAPADEEKAKLVEVGKAVYAQCAACHGPDGKSLIPTMAPNLAGSSLVSAPAEAPVALVLNGIQAEGRYQGVMIPWKAMLSDEQIAGVLTYIRSSFGNDAPKITPAMVAHAREKYAGQAAPMTRSALESMDASLPEG